MKRVLALALAIALAGSMCAVNAQEGTGAAAKSPRKKKAAAVPAVSTQLNELKDAIEAQQKQLQMLGDQIQSRDQRIQQLEQRLDQSQAAATQAQARADAAASQTADEAQTVSSLKSDVTDLKTNATGVAMTLQETQKALKDQFESPLAIHFKGITLTPGGFLASESVYRTRALGADINTQFNGLNFPGIMTGDTNDQAYATVSQIWTHDGHITDAQARATFAYLQPEGPNPVDFASTYTNDFVPK